MHFTVFTNENLYIYKRKPHDYLTSCRKVPGNIQHPLVTKTLSKPAARREGNALKRHT